MRKRRINFPKHDVLCSEILYGGRKERNSQAGFNESKSHQYIRNFVCNVDAKSRIDTRSDDLIIGSGAEGSRKQNKAFMRERRQRNATLGGKRVIRVLSASPRESA